MCPRPPCGDTCACPAPPPPPPPTVVTSCCATVLCRKCTWLHAGRVPPCHLPRGPSSPLLWEIPSATSFSHAFPPETAEQGRPILFANALFPASSLPFDCSPPTSWAAGPGLRSCFLSFPGDLLCPIIFPSDPDLPGFHGPLLQLL